MHLVTTVTEDHQVSLSLRREAYGETDRAEVVVLTVQQARAYAALLVRVADAADRRSIDRRSADRRSADRQGATPVVEGRAA
jgi:hypothetical protein